MNPAGTFALTPRLRLARHDAAARAQSSAALQAAGEADVWEGLRPDRLGGWFDAAIWHRDSALVGGIWLVDDELSYFVGPQWRGQGIGGEAVAAFCRHAVTALRMPGLRARVGRENAPSRRLVERCGFAFAGLLPPDRSHRGTWLLYRLRGEAGIVL